MRIHVAHSPDSDDAFMFYALAEGKIDTEGFEYVHELQDIESLNQLGIRDLDGRPTAGNYIRSMLGRDYFIVATSQPGLQIRALATHDRQGGDSVIAFMNLKENQGIPDKEFAFRIPKGADVITNGGN